MDEQNKAKENDLNLINYRLTAIEKELKELKDLLVTVPLLMKQLETTTKTFDEKINIVENKIKQNEVNNDLTITEVSKIKTDFAVLKNDHKADIVALKNELKSDINEIKNISTKKAAARFDHIIDYIFKGLVIIAIGYLFIPFGG